MIGSQYVAYLNPATGEVRHRPGSAQREPGVLERHIADVLKIRTNTVAGRPNVGNLALEFTQRGRALPPGVLRDYLLRTLRAFIPNVAFSVEVDAGLDSGGFQRFTVEYRA